MKTIHFEVRAETLTQGIVYLSVVAASESHAWNIVQNSATLRKAYGLLVPIDIYKKA